MNFEGDAFISYAHRDNVTLQKGTDGWVANLHRALEIRVAEKLGRQPNIWRDPELTGNDVFSEKILARIRRVAALISVVSPSYIKSEWTRRELLEFWKAAEEQGGIQLREKSRIFKVLKTRVPIEKQAPELQPLLGYEFFKVHPVSGRVRDLDEIFGLDARTDFWLRLDDLACDIAELLDEIERLREASQPASEASGIYLAEATSDLRDERDALKRDLREHGHTLYPSHPLPLVGSELAAVVREELGKCRMSIHLIGKNYSLVPEGEVRSALEIQNELAIERAEKGNFSRLLWIPSGLRVEDDRQKKIIEALRMDPRMQKGADLLETPLADLKTMIEERLKQAPVPSAEPSGAPAAKENVARLYLIYDQRDASVASTWVDALFKLGFEVIRPVFEGDAAEIREYEEENLCTCDGALILYGEANECWLRRKLGQLQKSPGYGRTKPMPAIAIALLPPKTPEKESFQTHMAMIVPQWNGFSADSMQPFISRLNV